MEIRHGFKTGFSIWLMKYVDLMPPRFRSTIFKNTLRKYPDKEKFKR
jgi:hypothetical protein